MALPPLHDPAYGCRCFWTAQQVPSAPFNPFAAGPKVRSSAPTSAGSSGHRTVPLTALRSSGGAPSSTTPAAQQAKIQAKLQALYEEGPAWLISPGQLTLEQGPDGQFVLLGSGAYGRWVYALDGCAKGWVCKWTGPGWSGCTNAWVGGWVDRWVRTGGGLEVGGSCVGRLSQP